MSHEPGGPDGEEDPLLNTVLVGRYRLLEKLGEGGMGAVYRGVHETLRKPVAVKILPRAARSNKELVTRFEREAVAAANLKHPGIAEVTDSGQAPDGLLFMVMEYVEGRTLGTLLAQTGRLAPARALHLLRQIGAAVTFAHGREVVHRDLKPDNIVVFDRGEERDLVKVIDFGIARMRSSFGGGASGLTRAGTVVGTVEYMAPEQAMGQAVDARADEYALGVIAFEMLTGGPPYVSDDVANLVFMHVGAAIPALTSRAPELAAYRGLDEVVAKMMGKLPDERYASVADAIAALAGAIHPPALAAAPAVTSGTIVMPTTLTPVVTTARGTIISQATPAAAATPTAAATPGAPSPARTRAQSLRGLPARLLAAARRPPPPLLIVTAISGAVALSLFMMLIAYLWSRTPAAAAAPTASAVPAEVTVEPPALPPRPTLPPPGPPHDKGKAKVKPRGK